MIRDPKIFELYRPFRNNLAAMNLLESLYVIWGYSRNYIFDKYFPADIEKLPNFNPYESDLHLRKFRGGFFDHELEFLMKEIIINCDIAPRAKKLKERSNSIKVINYLRGVLNEGIDKSLNLEDNILFEFNRIGSRQFKWQLHYNINTILRYYKIYSTPGVSDIIYNKLKLTPLQINLIGSLLFRFTAENFITPFPKSSETKIVTAEMMMVYLKTFGIELNEIKHELKNHQQINGNLFYTYNPLIAKPIILAKDGYMCPIPLLIYWQMTDGIYYSICGEKNFSKAFGDSFQLYIGEVLEKSCDKHNIQIYPEETYGKEHKKTSDWILIDNDSVVFIECKTKRMRFESKSQFGISEELKADIKILAEAIKQLYKTYINYSKNLYNTLKFDELKHFFPLVLTLEDWQINWSTDRLELLKEFVLEEFDKHNIDKELLNKFPYYIDCASTFERNIQVINEIGINNYFQKLSTNQLAEYIDHFKFKDIFEGEFERLFVKPFLKK